jgi:hypothetical protein
MSWNIDILVNTTLSLEALAKELKAVLNIPLEQKSDKAETWYEYDDPRFNLTVGTNGLENDRNLNFEDYPYTITIWPRKPYNKENKEMWYHDFVGPMFEKLKANGQYGLMLVVDVQQKLEEFRPVVETAL